MILGVGNRRDKAQAALAKGDTAKAAALLEKVLDSEPGDLKVRRQLADLYRDIGQPEDAIRHYEALAGHHAAAGLLLRAISSCKAILELDPGHRATLEVLSQLYAKKGTPHEATLPPTMSAALVPPAIPDDDEELDDDDILVEAAAGEAEVEITDHEVVAEADDESESTQEVAADEVLEVLEVVARKKQPPQPPPLTNLPGPAAAFELSEADLDDLGEGWAAPDDDGELDVEAVHLDDDSLEIKERPAPRPTAPGLRELAGEGAQRRATVNTDALAPSPLFGALGRRAFEGLVARLAVRRVTPGVAIVRQGEEGDRFFVIASGRVRVEREGPEGPVVVGHLGEGAFFGEIAILARNLRSATVIAEEPTEVLEVTRQALDDIIARHPSVEQVLHRFCRARLIQNLLATSPLLAGLDEAQQQEIVRSFKPVTAAEGEVVIRQGQPGFALYLVLLGSMQVAVTGEDGTTEVVDELHEGDVFGEMGLFFREPANATVSALCSTRLLRLSGGSFGRFCARYPEVRARLHEIGQRRAADHDRRRFGIAVAPHPSV